MKASYNGLQWVIIIKNNTFIHLGKGSVGSVSQNTSSESMPRSSREARTLELFGLSHTQTKGSITKAGFSND
jgi:hypothetical protein